MWFYLLRLWWTWVLLVVVIFSCIRFVVERVCLWQSLSLFNGFWDCFCIDYCRASYVSGYMVNEWVIYGFELFEVMLFELLLLDLVVMVDQMPLSCVFELRKDILVSFHNITRHNIIYTTSTFIILNLLLNTNYICLYTNLKPIHYSQH